MKKRTCRHHCDICVVNFESWDRYSVHLTSRRHRMKQLATRTTTQNIQLVSDASECPTDLYQDEFLFLQEPECHEVRLEDNSDDSGSYDIFCDFTSSDSEEESDSDNAILQRPPEHGNGLYFPFPSEIFFLLYSYVHNVSRPKVIFIFMNLSKN